ncbi:MAG TPA: serine hydrolase domain-containing protein [Capillimicrobium sp.]|nr:serine hydrolase domain-containing protein [Capillimicrobium sp.]
MKNRHALAAASVAMAALVAAAPAAGAQDSHADLGAELRELVRMPGGPAGAVVVVQRPDGRTVYTAGVRDTKTKAPVRARDHMRIASAAKAFSAAVALSLVQEGRLSLDDTIAQRLPWLPAAWGRVTLRQALNHTSGLPDFSHSPAFRDALVKDLHGTPAPRTLLRYAANERLAFPPGSRYRYSNTDNFIAALMAEAVTGRDYTRLLATQVTRPLRLRDTSLPRGARMPSPYLHGYQPDPPRAPEDVSTLISGAWSWASGGIVSTPADLTAFIRGYAGARLFDRATQRKQMTFRPGRSEPKGPGRNSAGLGIFRYRTQCGTVYGHTGNTPGYTQFMAATKDGRRSVTVSINAQITDKSTGEQGKAFRRLRRIEGQAVCEALASKRDAALSASIQKALDAAKAPGAIVGVWQPGKPAYVGTFGVRDTATDRPMRRDLHMRIGSVTKTFTVTALLQLVDQGKVSLDDPISTYVDGVIEGDRITLRQLATMRSGLVNYTMTEPFDQALTENPYRSWTPQELLSFSIGGPLEFPPGEGFTYSNTNTILLGLVIEKVSGQSIADFIAQHISAPLGMKRTSFPAGTEFPRPHASGYTRPAPSSPVTDATAWNPTWTWSAGQMVSTLADMRAWAPRLVTGRGLLSPATAQARAASVAGPADPIVYGLGLFKAGGWIGHNGSLPGFQTLVLHRPETKATIVVFINTDVEHDGSAPSTLVGQAITETISPGHVYTLPAAPTTDQDD